MTNTSNTSNTSNTNTFASRNNTFTNLERIKLELQDFNITDEELSLRLEENSLAPDALFQPSSNANKKAIQQTVLGILQAMANSPTLMKNFKMDDMTISSFSEHLQARIDQLERQIRQMPQEDFSRGGNYFMLFNS